MKTKINNARRLLPCWLRVMSLMLLSCLSIEASAQIATFGAPGVAGSVSDKCGPIARLSATSTEDFSQHYYLYTAADMAAAGIFPGSTITAIGWYKANNGATAAGNTTSSWRIHMKNSSAVPSPTWCSSSYATQSSGATLVYANLSQNIPNTIGWITLPLTTPFVYTGGSLEVGSFWNCSLFTGNPTTSGISWNKFATAPLNQTFGARGTSASLVMINESCSPISQLVFTAPSSCSTIGNVGNTISSVTATCPNTPFNLSLQFPPPAAPGIDYLWESADDIDFLTNVNSLGTTSTYTVLATEPKYYRCQVTCNSIPITAFSTPVFVDVYGAVVTYAAGLNINCHGDNDGEIYLSTSGGAAPYTYNWNSGAYSTADLTGLSGGTYSVVVTDANGCTAGTSTTITSPTILSYSSIVTNVSAIGANDGAIQVNAAGGTPPYNYSNDGGTNYQNLNSFNNLAATLYPMRLQDANGCITAFDETVGNPLFGIIEPSINFQVEDVEDTIPHLMWNVPVGIPVQGYVVERSADGVNFLPIANVNAFGLVDILGLPPGSISAFGSILYTTENSPRFIFNDIIPNLNSSSNVFYRIRLMLAGSTVPHYSVTRKFLPPFIFNPPWPNLNPAPCPPIGFVPAGFVPTPFTSTQQIGCCLVTKRLFRKFGCAQPSPCVGKDCIPLCNCTYDPCCVHNCAQKAFCGCLPWPSCGAATQFQWIVIAAVSTAPVINTTQTNVSCNGGNNGTITIAGVAQFCKRNKIIGAPACFAASNPLPFPNALGQISNTFTGLCAGCYTIMVRDCNGCTATKVVCITQPTPITLTATSVNSCTCTGKITVNATGGTPCAPNGYTYQMLPSGIPQASNVFNNLCIGCYTIKVTDCNGCTKTIVKCISGSNLQVSPILVQPCFGVNNGSIQVISATVNPCLKYQIVPSCLSPMTAAATTSNLFANLLAGVYCINVKDTCTGCDTCFCVTLTNSTTPCGKTNSIVVNTGYDPITGTKIIPNGIVDPLWTVTAVGGAIFGPVNTSAHPAWAVNPNSHAIGFAGGDAAGTRTYRRKFKMCSCDSITFNLNLAYDNWLNGIYIDGVLITIPPTITPVAQQGWVSNFTTFHNFTFKRYLCAGTHTIDIKVVNLGGPSGLNLFGSVSGTTNSIVTNVSPVNCCCSCTIFNATPNVTNIGCAAGSTGSVCIVAPTSTNTSCWTYRLGTSCTNFTTTAQSSPCFSGLAAGNYCVKITDTCSGCDTCVCFTITQNPSQIQLSGIASGTCTCTGTITITAFSGTCPTGTFIYQMLPTGLPQTSNVFSNLCPGCYTILVTDCNGCTETIQVCVPIIGYLFNLHPVVTGAGCNGGGSVCILPNSGTLDPCLKFRIGATCNSTGAYQSSNCFNGLAPGNYCVKVYDTCTGCDTCICVNIPQLPGLQLTATSVNTCSCNGSITVNVVTASPCPPSSFSYTILPSGLTQSSNTFTGLCPGCYTIIVTDCNGCTASIVKCVLPTGTLQGLFPSTTNVTCNGGNNGTLCILNTAGVLNPCFKYRLGTSCTNLSTTSQILPCFTGLAAGNYCVKITDTCTGCDTCICVTITQPPAMQLTATSVNSCSCNSSITVNISGGSPCPTTSYTYTLLPSGLTQSSNTFTGLCPGCYTIIVTDCNGCTASIVKCVTGGNVPQVGAVLTHITCNGGNNGSICVLSPAPVNPCLKYKIGASCTSIIGTGTTNPCFTGLSAGNYCIKVTDTCTNCDTCICVTITQPAPITLTATSLNTCACNGSITVTATGGTPCPAPGGYSYTIFPGGTTQASPTFTGLCPGCYTIVVRDCNQCSATIVKCVIGVGGPTGLNAVVTNPLCNGGTGTICINNTTGTINPCLKYALASVNCQVTAATTFQTNPCFTGLPAGNYCVKIKDTCTNCDTCICVTITQPAPITLTATSLNTCACNGSITVTATGGTPCPAPGGYSYTIFPGGTTQASPTFTGLCPGCYTIVVRDCNQCSATIVKCVIGVGGPTGLNAVVTNPLCNGGTGTICINNTTGTINPCLKYALASVNCQVTAATTFQTNPCFTGLPAGNYCVKIKDTCTNCDTCICVTITQPAPITLTATSLNTCACNGSITVTATGGTPCPAPGGYSYTIFPGGTTQASPTFTGLCPGCYTIVVRDCNQCSATIVKCVIGVGGPTGLNAVVTNPLCNGGTGTICINNTTGTTNPCLKYALASVNCQVTAATAFQTNPCFTGLPAGNYCVKIKDTCTNCDTCICVTITQPAPITLTATSLNTCACNGSITVTATGGTPCPAPGGYSYTIFPGGTTQASPTFTGLCPGCYTIVVRDCNQCSATIVKCVIGVGGPTGLNAVVTNPLCNGGTGTICINNTTGTTNPCLKYALASVNCQVTAATTFQTNPCFTGLPAGNYCVKIKDTCTNCDTCICVTITQPAPITLTATSLNTCACNGSITVTATGGTPCPAPGGYSYTIFPGGTTQASPTFTGLCPGCYTIVVRDCNQCSATIVKCVIGVGGPTGLNAVVTNPLCNGGTGTICINNTTGTINPCLKYALASVNCQVTAATAFQTNPCFTGLPAGNYCVKIKDTCTNCDTCICVTITQPAPITLTATSLNTCACNGSITVTATGGTPCPAPGGYSYTIFPGGTTQASPTFTGLCPGCYTIVVRDCNQCSATIVKCVIGVGGPTGLNAVVTNPLCNGGTGTICINNTTGTTNPCLKYALASVNCQVTAATTFQTNPCFTGLPAGNYCVKIKDTCTNCDTCICVTITQPAPITLTATSLNTCACNGSITVTATGGTPCPAPGGYSYTIFPGGTTQASPTFTGLCPGCYTIVVRDCNQCSATIVKCVIGVGGPTGLNAVVTNPLCNGGTGTICINNTTGTTNPCLKYALASVNCQVTAATAFQTNPCFTGLPAGNYCVKIKDTCTNCDTCICVTITQPAPITLTATSLNTCACNGSITVTATGGTPCPAPGGYSYTIFPGGTTQASPTFTGLCPGCYTIVVRDCNQCSATIVKCVIGVGGPTGLNAVVTNPLCNGGTGTICINNTTGTINPCLKYALASVNCQVTAATAFQTNPCFTGLPAGNYCVKIKDTCTNCDTCICVTITQPAPITLTATSLNTCACNGSITVTATGGTPCPAPGGYSYTIFPGGTTQASPTFTGLCPGCYTIVVRDCNQCSATIVKCVIGVSGPTGLNAVVTNPLCNGGTGTICINNTTGTTNPCLKYALASVNCQVTAATAFQTNPCFTGLPAGNYCVKIKDTCTNCDTCICVTITQPAPMILTATAVTVCPCNSFITVNVIGGNPCPTPGGYTYQIFPSGLIQPMPTFTGLCPGCYTIVVTDCMGCTESIVKCVGPCGGNHINLNIQAFIQGYYVGGSMMAPVQMNQGVSTNPNVTDEITVELHSANPPFAMVATSTAILQTNGQASCTFNGAASGNYFIAMKHRNGIQTWSALPVPLSAAATNSYNFTTGANKAFGQNMTEVSPGVWAIYSGDVNQDENIDLTDISLYEIDALSFQFGYLPTDINGDGTVDLSDFPYLDLNANNFIFSSHP